MKKVQLGFMFLAAAFALTSCDGIINTIEDINNNELVGKASVEVTRTVNGVTTVVDSLSFTSSIVDALDVNLYDENLPAGFFTVDISANVDFNTSDVELQYPFMLYRIDDTTTKSYTMDNMLSVEMLQNLDLESIINVVATPDGPNMILIAVNDSCWYLSNGGELIVSEYPTVGNLVKANFSNINGRYITQRKVEELNNDIENNNFAHISDLDYYFPEVTLSGSITSRRWAITQTIYESAFINGGLLSK